MKIVRYQLNSTCDNMINLFYLKIRLPAIHEKICVLTLILTKFLFLLFSYHYLKNNLMK